MMKFQVAKSDLLEALQTVSGAMSSTEGDITSHFLFRISPKDAEQVEVLTSHQRVFASCPVKAKVMEVGDPFTVEGWRIKKWLGTIGDAAVVVEPQAGGDVKCDTGSYVQNFRSLDPQNFVFWDKTLEKSVSKGSLSASRLAFALKSARNFASLDESNMPEAVVVDVRNGMVTATDKRSVVSFFKVVGLESSGLRIHSKDVPCLAGFLASCEGDVEILESDRNLFMKRSDGATYGETRYQANYPNLSPPPSEDQRTWTVNTDALKRAVEANQAGAAKKDSRLYLSLPDEDGPLLVSMQNENGKPSVVSVKCEAVLNVATAPEIPKDGFPVSADHLLHIIDTVGCSTSDTITLGINVITEKKHRYIRVERPMFADDKGEGGDKYVHVLAGLLW